MPLFPDEGTRSLLILGQAPSPHFSRGFVARQRRRAWIQGARPGKWGGHKFDGMDAGGKQVCFVKLMPVPIFLRERNAVGATGRSPAAVESF
jgi:hypothetical protein